MGRRDDAAGDRLAGHAQPGPRPVLPCCCGTCPTSTPGPSARESSSNSLVGFNFGDGHLHNHDLIKAVQAQARFEPGELIVVWVESQPVHRSDQAYQVIDAALGVIERGTWQVADAVAEQPWLPNGPIPVQVTWSRPIGLQAAGEVYDGAEVAA